MRFKGPMAESFERSRALNLHGVSSDGHVYTCHECGRQWEPRERYAWWPFTVRWSPRPVEGGPVFAMWGAQIGADGPEQRVFARFVRVGPLVFRFGWREEWR